MKPTRRWFQYSLRSFLVLLTVLAVWPGIVVHRAREQRMLVERIESMGGDVVFAPIRIDDPQGRFPLQVKARLKLAPMVGYDYFAEIEGVRFERAPLPTDSEVLEVVPDLKRLRGLTHVTLPASVSLETWNTVEAALPKCTVGVAVQ